MRCLENNYFFSRTKLDKLRYNQAASLNRVFGKNAALDLASVISAGSFIDWESTETLDKLLQGILYIIGRKY